ncbi:hypothetical protein GWK16_10965 [Roseomonas sp. JC162]|uniref:Uncharacterized protein n=1 Tax=Neoroseomonas marina TaxID=1232220 RepID=A0A848EEH8_9PROT|nr:hypothetical protein [Neoroseomonas marina]NMJ41765.1 hypothetical protein [Neoroseomonas marina]
MLMIFTNWKMLALMGGGMVLLHLAISWAWGRPWAGLSVYAHWGAAGLMGLGIGLLHYGIISLLRPGHGFLVVAVLLSICIAAALFLIGRSSGRPSR